MRLYQMQDSGNCYKIRLLAHLLHLPLELVDIDILTGESRTENFLAKNPNGRVPVLELDDGRFLAESDAILVYLAENTPYWPEDRFARAEVLQWMFFEQYSHEPYIAVARFWKSISPNCPPEMRARFPEWNQRGCAALVIMEKHLTAQPYFVGNCYSIADIALFSYTHVADEGGFDIAPYPKIRDWIERIEGQPRHIDMKVRF
ncbi:MAG: glutathione S-transferase family protein [Parvibaculum sp.]